MSWKQRLQSLWKTGERETLSENRNRPEDRQQPHDEPILTSKKGSIGISLLLEKPKNFRCLQGKQITTLGGGLQNGLNSKKILSNSKFLLFFLLILFL